MVLREILHNHRRAIARIRYGDKSVFRLFGDEGLEVVPLAGRFSVERVVNQDGEVQRSVWAPIGDLHTLLTLKGLYAFFLYRRRCPFLRDGGNGEGGVISARWKTYKGRERE